jgi:hypothetical protein
MFDSSVDLYYEGDLVVVTMPLMSVDKRNVSAILQCVLEEKGEDITSYLQVVADVLALNVDRILLNEIRKEDYENAYSSLQQQKALLEELEERFDKTQLELQVNNKVMESSADLSSPGLSVETMCARLESYMSNVGDADLTILLMLDKVDTCWTTNEEALAAAKLLELTRVDLHHGAPGESLSEKDIHRLHIGACLLPVISTNIPSNPPSLQRKLLPYQSCYFFLIRAVFRLQELQAPFSAQQGKQ